MKEERFPNEFVTWNHKTPVGVKVQEVFGMDSKKGRTWIELARQIYCEEDADYKIIGHFPNGAPFIDGASYRISITHTKDFFAVASLPKTPEVNLEVFNTRSALGIDAEPLDRKQVIKVRTKFLSQEELALIPEEDVIANILAWTAKEALFKAALSKKINFKTDILIHSLQSLHEENSESYNLGKAVVRFPETSMIEPHEFLLYSYSSYGCCVTIAFSPKCAKYSKNNQLILNL